MSSRGTAISIRGLSKSYTLRHNQTTHSTLGGAIAHRLRHPLERAEREEFKALREVSFEVREGEVLGVIGRNGAGKSTLLKVLSRITAPTQGEIHIYGRVGSLLEVGTGFHPELTGRENIFLNGSILGMRRREISRRFDEIVEFAGVAQFLDTPVKRYSSGMYVRLAFAVAAHLDADVLLVDEVLAVGDAEFQRKSLDKMDAVAHSGRTVVFVSHQLQAVASLCQRAVLLNHGQLDAIDATAQVIKQYGEQALPLGSSGARRVAKGGITAVRLGATALGYSDPISLEVEFDAPPEPDLFVDVRVTRNSTDVLCVADSRLQEVKASESGAHLFEFEIRGPWPAPGRWTIDVRLGIDKVRWVDEWLAAADFEVLAVGAHPVALESTEAPTGLAIADFGVTSRKLSAGA